MVATNPDGAKIEFRADPPSDGENKPVRKKSPYKSKARIVDPGKSKPHIGNPGKSTPHFQYANDSLQLLSSTVPVICGLLTLCSTFKPSIKVSLLFDTPLFLDNQGKVIVEKASPDFLYDADVTCEPFLTRFVIFNDFHSYPMKHVILT